MAAPFTPLFQLVISSLQATAHRIFLGPPMASLKITQLITRAFRLMTDVVGNFKLNYSYYSIFRHVEPVYPFTKQMFLTVIIWQSTI